MQWTEAKSQCSYYSISLSAACYLVAYGVLLIYCHNTAAGKDTTIAFHNSPKSVVMSFIGINLLHTKPNTPTASCYHLPKISMPHYASKFQLLEITNGETSAVFKSFL